MFWDMMLFSLFKNFHVLNLFVEFSIFPVLML